MARERAGLSQESLGRKVAVARTNYIAWENGGKPPSAASLKKLAAALGIPSEDLTSTDRSEATLRDLREWAGLTQSAVADCLGFASTSAWASIESGAIHLSDRHRQRLASLFDSSERELVAAWGRSLAASSDEGP